MKKMSVFIILISLCVFNGCISSAWREVTSIDTLSAYEEFIRNNPQSKYNSLAIKKIEYHNWLIADSINTPWVYRKFLKKFPNSQYSDSAINAIMVIEWEVVKSKDKIREYKKFINSYPDSKYAKDANMRIDAIKAAWSVATKINTIESYKKFSETWDKTEYADSAYFKLDKYAFRDWENSRRMSTVDGYNKFLQSWGKSQYSEFAKDSLDKLLWRNVKREMSFDALNFYLKNSPVERDEKEIETCKKKILWLKELADRYYKNLQHKDKKVSESAMISLAILRDKRAVEYLNDLKFEGNKELEKKVGSALNKLNDTTAINVLLRLVRSSPSVENIKITKRYDYDVIHKELYKIALNNKMSLKVRKEALSILTYMNQTYAIEIAKIYLESKNNNLIVTSMKTLSSMKDTSLADKVIQIAEKGNSEIVKASISCMNAYGEREQKYLGKLINSSDKNIARSAAMKLLYRGLYDYKKYAKDLLLKDESGKSIEENAKKILDYVKSKHNSSLWKKTVDENPIIVLSVLPKISNELIDSSGYEGLKDALENDEFMKDKWKMYKYFSHNFFPELPAKKKPLKEKLSFSERNLFDPNYFPKSTGKDKVEFYDFIRKLSGYENKDVMIIGLGEEIFGDLIYIALANGRTGNLKYIKPYREYCDSIINYYAVENINRLEDKVERNLGWLLYIFDTPQGNKILDDAIRNNRYKLMSGGVNYYIRQGKSSNIPKLIKLLPKSGRSVANSYLNSGNKRLANAARKWAKERGYQIQTTSPYGSARWGRK